MGLSWTQIEHHYIIWNYLSGAQPLVPSQPADRPCRETLSTNRPATSPHDKLYDLKKSALLTSTQCVAQGNPPLSRFIVNTSFLKKNICQAQLTSLHISIYCASPTVNHIKCNWTYPPTPASFFFFFFWNWYFHSSTERNWNTTEWEHKSHILNRIRGAKLHVE